MKKPGKVYAIIPARGGSRGLPQKNILPLAGKPLIAYTIDAALDCPAIANCIVSTDDPEIKGISAKLGAEVFDRPAKLATDTALIQDAVRQVLELLDARGDFPEYFVLLQPTSPLRTADHLQDCIIKYFGSEALCAVSVTDMKQHPYKAFVINGINLQPLFDSKSLHQPRQLLPSIYVQNGAVYLMPSRLFLERNSFFVEPAMPYFMSPEDSVDIDSQFDLMLADFSLKFRTRTKMTRLCRSTSADGK